VLRFPNIRLFVHNLFMAEGLSGSEAIAHCAGELGLISPESVVKSVVREGEGACQCRATAKNVLTTHFAERPNPMPVAVDTEELWSTVEERVEKAMLSLTTEKKPSWQETGTISPCYMHAPALMDIMVQQISCYPDA